jgi:hypothetical protein
MSVSISSIGQRINAKRLILALMIFHAVQKNARLLREDIARRTLNIIKIPANTAFPCALLLLL